MVPLPPFFFLGVAAVDAYPAGGGDSARGGDVVRGRPEDLLFFTGAGATSIDGLSYTYPCVMSCPVYFCLFAVYVRFLLIFIGLTSDSIDDPANDCLGIAR